MPATVDPSVAGVLAYVDAIREEMRALWPVPDPTMRTAMRRLRHEWTYHSAALVGSPLDRHEVRELLTHDRVSPDKRYEAHALTRRHAKAIRLVEMLSETEGVPTAEAGARIHRVLAPEVPPDDLPSAPLAVPVMTGAHPIVRATVFHVAFLDGWPLDDPTVATSRLLTSLVLMRAGYLPALFRADRHDDYARALRAAHDGASGALVRYIAEEVAATMERFLGHLREGEEPGGFRERVDALADRVLAVKAARGYARGSTQALVSDVLAPLHGALGQTVDAFRPRVFGSVRSRGVTTTASGARLTGGLLALRASPWARSLATFDAQWTLSRHVLHPDLRIRLYLRASVGADESVAVHLGTSRGTVGELKGTLSALPSEVDVRNAVDAVRARLVAEADRPSADVA